MTVNFNTGSAAEESMSKMLDAMISSRRVRPDSFVNARLRDLIFAPFIRGRRAEPDQSIIASFSSRKGYKSASTPSMRQSAGRQLHFRGLRPRVLQAQHLVCVCARNAGDCGFIRYLRNRLLRRTWSPAEYP